MSYSHAWNKVRRHAAVFASEWTAARVAQEKAEKEAREAAEERCRPWIDRVGAYVEEHLKELKLDHQYVGCGVTIDIPATFFAGFDRGDDYVLKYLLQFEQRVHLSYPDANYVRARIDFRAEPEILPVVRDAMGEPIAPTWFFMGCTGSPDHRDLDEITEFDPSSAAKGKEILWLLREAYRRRKQRELIIAMKLIRDEGEPKDPQVGGHSFPRGLSPTRSHRPLPTSSCRKRH